MAHALLRAPIKNVRLAEVHVRPAWAARVAYAHDEAFVAGVRREPLIVAAMPEWMRGRDVPNVPFVLLAGVRQHRAHQRAGVELVSARVLGADTAELLAAVIALVGSPSDKEHLSAHARACFFDELSALGAGIDAISSMTRYAVSTVQNYLYALRNVEPEIVQAWQRDEVAISWLQRWMYKPTPVRMSAWREYQAGANKRARRPSSRPAAPTSSTDLYARALRALERGETSYPPSARGPLMDWLRYFAGEPGAPAPAIQVDFAVQRPRRIRRGSVG
ncbi:MAG: hypothetical protein SFX73_00795 [Kofleriaceae bacterium]|nr:hypothetical protein [Kofleriaceae bacterium]